MPTEELTVCDDDVLPQRVKGRSHMGVRAEECCGFYVDGSTAPAEGPRCCVMRRLNLTPTCLLRVLWAPTTGAQSNEYTCELAGHANSRRPEYDSSSVVESFVAAILSFPLSTLLGSDGAELVLLLRTIHSKHALLQSFLTRHGEVHSSLTSKVLDMGRRG